MLIYIVTPFLFLATYICTRFIHNYKLSKLLSALIPSIILFVILGFKGSTVGADSITYVNAYYYFKDIPRFPDPGFFQSLNGFNFKDEFGFILFAQLFSNLGFPYLVFQLLIYSVVCFSIFYSTWRLSKDPIFSILFFYCFTYFNFYVSGLRQCFAISLCLIAVTLILSGGRTMWRSIIYFLLVGFASFWHISAFIFVLPFFFIRIKISTKSFMILLFFSVFFFILGAEMYELINVIATTILDGNIGDYAPFSFGKGLTSLLMLGLVAFAFYLHTPSRLKERVTQIFVKFIPAFAKNKTSKAFSYSSQKHEDSVFFNDNYSFFVIMCFIGIWLMFTSSYSISFGRINMYFSIFIIYLIPNEINKIENIRIKYFSKIIIFVALLAYFAYTAILTNYLGIAPYYFIRGTV